MSRRNAERIRKDLEHGGFASDVEISVATETRIVLEVSESPRFYMDTGLPGPWAYLEGLRAQGRAVPIAEDTSKDFDWHRRQSESTWRVDLVRPGTRLTIRLRRFSNPTQESDNRLIVYLDQSGNDDWLSLSGLAGPAAAWSGFDECWQEILDKYDDIEYLHMAGLKDKHRKVALRLIKECLYSRLQGDMFIVSSHLLIPDFEEAKRDGYGVPEKPQSITAGSVVNRILGWSVPRFRLGERSVRLVFDKGDQQAGRIMDARQRDTNTVWRYYLADPEKAVVKETPGLQSADFVAWTMHQQMIPSTLTSRPGWLGFVNHLQLGRVQRLVSRFDRAELVRLYPKTGSVAT